MITKEELMRKEVWDEKDKQIFKLMARKKELLDEIRRLKDVMVYVAKHNCHKAAIAKRVLLKEGNKR